MRPFDPNKAALSKADQSIADQSIANPSKANLSVADLAVTESAMADWRIWQADLPEKPQIVRSLGKGLSNQSFLLKAGTSHMVLRINNNHKQLPGIDRQREADIWRAAYQKGIAPQLLHADNGSLVSKYVPDELTTSNKFGDAAFNDRGNKDDLADEVFRLIESCHQIEVDIAALNYAQHIETYWDKIERSGKPVNPALTNQRQPMLEALLALKDQQPATVLCHHDPVIANFVGAPKRLYLIDWEYAAKGMAVMDYAALAVEWGFSDATICSRTNIRLDSLVMAKKLYRYMCQLWAVA